MPFSRQGSQAARDFYEAPVIEPPPPPPGILAVTSASLVSPPAVVGIIADLTATLTNATTSPIVIPGVEFWVGGVKVAWQSSPTSIAGNGGTATLTTDASNGLRWTPVTAGTFVFTAKPGSNGVLSGTGELNFNVTVDDAPVTPGGGDPGGGLPDGVVPTLPANSTVGRVGGELIGWNSSLPNFIGAFQMGGLRTAGWRHHSVSFSNDHPYGEWGGTSRFKSTDQPNGVGVNIVSAGANPTDSSYAQQSGMEGFANTSLGVQANSGTFVYKRTTDSGMRCWLGGRLCLRYTDSAVKIVDHVFDSAYRARFCASIANWAAGVKFLGGNGIYFDLEVPTGTNDTATPGWGRHIGKTNQQMADAYEQFGYEIGIAMYQTANFPACDLLWYSWNSPGQWRYAAGTNGSTYVDPVTDTNGDVNTRYFLILGIMRANTERNATGGFINNDSWFYRGVQHAGSTYDTALKWNLQGSFSALSRDLSTAIWTHCAPKFYILASSWAGTLGTGFYPNTQQGEPLSHPERTTYWTVANDFHRKWGMGGMRAEYVGGTEYYSATGLWAGGSGSDYTIPIDRASRMAAQASSSPVASAPPTITNMAAVSTAGNVTVTCNVSHAFGAHYVSVYRGLNFNPANPTPNLIGMMEMVWNLNGGTITTNIDNSFQACNLTCPGSAGEWFVIRAFTVKEDVGWARVQATGSAFRLFVSTSPWNTDHTALTTFATGADARLSTLSYGLNNTLYCHPFYKAVATDPVWTCTSTRNQWVPNRTVHIQMPVGIANAQGTDSTLSVMDPTGRLWDFWGIQTLNPATHIISTLAMVDTDGVAGTGFGTLSPSFTPAGTTAIGSPQVGGTILASDVITGTINHGLDMAFDYVDSGGVGTSGTPSVYPPAISNDVGGGPGPIPQGGLMRATGSEPAGLNTMEHQLWLACVKYGVYCTDQLGGIPRFTGDGSSLVGNAFHDAALTAIGRKLRLVRTW